MMSVTIKGHDPTKRYRVEYRYGTVRKKLLIPAGEQMPVRHTHEWLPVGKVLAIVSEESAMPQMSAFEIDKPQFKFVNDILSFSNDIPAGKE